MAVTIKTLHVSGKQMTLAVFRQLPKSCERKGSELWGVVRYAIKDEGDVWLVFSHDGTLFRRALELEHRWVDKSKLLELTDNLKHAESNWKFQSICLKSDHLEKEKQYLENLRESVKVAQIDYERRL